MIRFIGWRVLLILFVAVAIVYFVHLGMQLMGNPADLPSHYDFFDHSRLAWRQTREFLADAAIW